MIGLPCFPLWLVMQELAAFREHDLPLSPECGLSSRNSVSWRAHVAGEHEGEQGHVLTCGVFFRRAWPGCREHSPGSGNSFSCRQKHKQSESLWVFWKIRSKLRPFVQGGTAVNATYCSLLQCPQGGQEEGQDWKEDPWQPGEGLLGRAPACGKPRGQHGLQFMTSAWHSEGLPEKVREGCGNPLISPKVMVNELRKDGHFPVRWPEFSPVEFRL